MVNQKILCAVVDDRSALTVQKMTAMMKGADEMPATDENKLKIKISIYRKVSETHHDFS